MYELLLHLLLLLLSHKRSKLEVNARIWLGQASVIVVQGKEEG